MIPAHHPSEDLWLDYTSGQVDAATRTLLDAHLAYCETCRSLVGQLAQPGARIVAEASPASPAPQGLLEGILSRLKAPEAPAVGGEALPLPRALWPLLPDLSRATWRGALTPGFRFLQVLQEGGPGLFLIHMAAGRPFPRHGHLGLERSLVLSGGLQDEQGVMEPGDFEEMDASHIHTPVALPDEDCWLLASLEGGIQFKGWRGVLQRMAG